jgi:predicted nucleic acid-binding protein
MPDKVLVDTSVWIEFFRKRESSISLRLREYLKLNQTCYTGPIAVELYQGAKTEREIHVIDRLLETIDYVEINREHYFLAGRTSQLAARRGKIFSTIDMIIAVLAHAENLLLFSLDHHFQEIAQFLPGFRVEPT